MGARSNSTGISTGSPTWPWKPPRDQGRPTVVKVRRLPVSGLLFATVLLASCASSAESDEADPDAVSRATDQLEADDDLPEARSDTSWQWTGILIQESDGTTSACFGDVQPSDSPSCPSGMPVLDVDLSAATRADSYPDLSKSVASAEIVGRPIVDGFVLDAPISEAVAPLERLDCEPVETGEASGDPLNPQPAFDLLEGPAAEEAGVWFTTDFGAEVRLEVSVLILDEGTRDWFQTQPEFDGFELTVCPQLREM